MRFTIALVSQCAGGNHVHGTISINGGAAQPFRLTRDEIKGAADGVNTPDEKRTLILQRLRSAVLESGATTNAQIKTAVEAQEWQV